MKMSRGNDRQRKESPYMEMSRDNDQKRCVYRERKAAPKSFFNFHSLKSLSATSILSCSPMAYNTTASLDKLTCTDYVDFGKSSDRFGRISWSKNDSNYLDVKLKVFKRGHKSRVSRLKQNLPMGEADFNQFIRQRNQLVIAADIFLREQNLSPVLQSTLSKDMEEQLKLVHKVKNVVDCPNRRICVTLLRYKVDNPEISCAQVCLFGRKKEEGKFQQIVYVNYGLDEFVYLLDDMNSVYHKVIANQPICNILREVIATIYSNHLFFLIESG